MARSRSSAPGGIRSFRVRMTQRIWYSFTRLHRGHGSRAIELMRAILSAQPDAEWHVRSAAAPWLFQATAPPGIDMQTVEVDTGMTQIDSLRIDEDASARAAAVFYGAFHRRVEAE